MCIRLSLLYEIIQGWWKQIIPTPTPLDFARIKKRSRSKKINILIITVRPPQIFEPSTGSGQNTNSPQAQTNNGDVDANKGILVDLLNLLVQAPKSATLKSLIFINQIEDGLNDSTAAAGASNNTKKFFVLLKEYLHASLDQHQK